MEGVEYTASSSNEVQQVVESMMGKVDAIYTPTDNTIASAMTVIASIANENKVPTVCGEVAHVEAGGLASVSINYEELGRRAGEMAVRILTEGSNPAEMPIETMTADECDLVYNQKTADRARHRRELPRRRRRYRRERIGRAHGTLTCASISVA